MASTQRPKRSNLNRDLYHPVGVALLLTSRAWLDSYHSYSPKTQRLFRESIFSKLVPWLAGQTMDHTCQQPPETGDYLIKFRNLRDSRVTV